METKDIIYTIMMAATPIIETRGAVPFAILRGMPVLYAVMFSVLGSIIPVLPLYYVFSPVGGWVRNVPVFNRAFAVLERNANKKGQSIQKWEALGLFLFVAVPLPMTGVWTGTTAAAILKINMKYALISIAFGSLVSGIIMALLTNGVLAL